MSQDLQELDDLFRSGLEGKEESPPRSVWEAVEKRLDSPNPTHGSPAKPTSPKTGPGWMKGLGGIAIVGIIAASFLMSRKDASTVEAGNSAVVKSQGMEASTPTQTDERERDQPSKATTREEPGLKGQVVPAENPIDGDKPMAAGKARENDGMNRVRSIGSLFVKSSDAAVPSIPTVLFPATNAAQEIGKQERKVALVKSENENSMKAGASSRRQIPSSDNQTSSQPPATVGNTRPPNNPSTRTVDQKGFEDRMMGNVMSQIQSGPPAGAEVAAEKRKMPGAKSNGMDGISTSDLLQPDAIRSSDAKELKGGNASDALGKNSPKSLKPSRFLSRFSVTPVMAYNHTSIEVRENRFHMGRPGDDRRSFRETEQSAATLSPGILAEFRITPALSIQSGVLGLTNRLRIDEKDIKAVKDRDGSIRYRLDCSAGSYFIDPKSGTVPNAGDSIRIGSSEVRTKYVSIPLTLQLRGGKGRVRYFGTAGVDVNLLTGKQASAVLKGASNEPVSPVRSEGLKSAFASGVVGGGMDIRMTKRMSVTVQPQYRFSLKKVNEGSRENAYPKTFSVMTGLKFDF